MLLEWAGEINDSCLVIEKINRNFCFSSHFLVGFPQVASSNCSIDKNYDSSCLAELITRIFGRFLNLLVASVEIVTRFASSNLLPNFFTVATSGFRLFIQTLKQHFNKLQKFVFFSASGTNCNLLNVCSVSFLPLQVEALEAIAKSANVEAEMFFLQGFISAAEDRLLPSAGAAKQVGQPQADEKKKIRVSDFFLD